MTFFIKYITLTICLFSSCLTVKSQDIFSQKDSLKGFLSEFRNSYDVYHYDLQVELLPNKKEIIGKNTISIRTLKNIKTLQIDLLEQLSLDSILFHGKRLNFKRKFDAVFIDFPNQISENVKEQFTVHYSGKPQTAKRPPWDGGFSWVKDAKERDWITVSCQGIGASTWWACKDHVSDEPDSMRITGIVPKELTFVSNGNLIRTEEKGNKKLFEWKVSYPINNYNVSVNVGHYQNFKDAYYSPTKKDSLELDYYVLDYNIGKAKKHFQQVKPMLSVYEELLGEYPFWNDGFALVEVNYWGMEHQSAVAYGNEYNNNDFGFDFIIIHESGHEYFGNSISALDQAEFWIHESFTTYLEALYIEKTQNLSQAIAYMNTQKVRIKNEYPIIGAMHVASQQEDADMYFKGTWLLHTLRNVLNDDEKWFSILKSYYQKYKLQNIHSEQASNSFSKATNVNLTSILRTILIPKFTYQVTKQKHKWELNYRWENTSQDFAMPIDVSIGKTEQRIYPTTEWQKMEIDSNKIAVDTNRFYVDVEKQ